MKEFPCHILLSPMPPRARSHLGMPLTMTIRNLRIPQPQHHPISKYDSIQVQSRALPAIFLSPYDTGYRAYLLISWLTDGNISIDAHDAILSHVEPPGDWEVHWGLDARISFLWDKRGIRYFYLIVIPEVITSLLACPGTKQWLPQRLLPKRLPAKLQMPSPTHYLFWASL